MRKSRAKKRPLAPDTKYKDPMVTRFVNMMMLDGKKSTAFKVFYDAMAEIERMSGDNGYEVWKKGLKNVMPAVEVKSRRIGGATFQIPIEIRPDRKISIGMKWMISFARKRNGKSMANKLAQEVLAASKNEGAAVKRKDDTHRMAEANKAFSHFRV